MDKRHASKQPNGEDGGHVDAGPLTIFCIRGQTPGGVPLTVHADPWKVAREYKAFQIGDPSHVANSTGRASLRTIRPGSCVLVDAGNDETAGTANVPFVAVVRQIYRSVEGAVKVAVQWMYRPDEAASEGAHPSDGWRPREIMFSRHVDEIEPQQVMHPVQVHFLRYGTPEPSWLLGSTHADLRQCPVPGFLCFRSWDIIRKQLLKNVAGQRPQDFLDKDDQKMTLELNWLMGLTSKRLAEASAADKEKRERLKQVASGGARTSGTGPSSAAGRGSGSPRLPSSPPYAPASRPGESQAISIEQQRPLSAQAEGAGGSSGARDRRQLHHSSAATQAADMLSGLLNAHPRGFDTVIGGRVLYYVEELIRVAGSEAEVERGCWLPGGDSMQHLLHSIRSASHVVLARLAAMGMRQLLLLWVQPLTADASQAILSAALMEAMECIPLDCVSLGPRVSASAGEQSLPSAAAAAVAVCQRAQSAGLPASRPALSAAKPPAAANNGSRALQQQQQQQQAAGYRSVVPETKTRGKVTTEQLEKFISVLKVHGYDLDKLSEALPKWSRKSLHCFWKNHSRVDAKLQLSQYVRAPSIGEMTSTEDVSAAALEGRA